MFAEYQNLDLYNTCADSDDFVQGRNLEIWIKPLDTGEDIPPFKDVILSSNVSLDDETADINVNENFVIYAGDILYYPDEPTILLITRTQLLTTGSNTIAIAPAISDLTAGISTSTLAMIPLRSAVDGGGFTSSKTSALARTKISVIVPHRSSSSQDGLISVSGQNVVNDVALQLIDDNPNKRYFVETRYNSYIKFGEYEDFDTMFGAGVNAIYGQFILEPFNLTVVRNTYIEFDLTFVQDGCVGRYLSLIPPSIDPNALRYCPLSPIVRNPIDYTIIQPPVNLVIGYCPLDNSVRNPVNYTPVTPTPTTVNGYCPLDASVKNPIPFDPGI